MSAHSPSRLCGSTRGTDLRPTWRLAGAAGLWLILEWYGASSEVSWLFLLAAWVLALVVMSAAYAFWNRAGLRLRLSVGGTTPGPGSPVDELPERIVRSGPHPAPVFEGDGIDVEITVDTSGASRGPAWVTGLLAGAAFSRATGLVPKLGWRRREELSDVRRGPVGATGWTVGSGDPLGFFRGTRRCADMELALVLPRFAQLRGPKESRELEASVAAPRSGSGNEMFGIREYRPGDSLRRIHWRSSARHGELVVREYEPPGVQTLAIYVDASPGPRQVADQVARLAASEAWDCIREGGRVALWGPGLEPSRSSNDLWSHLEWLARYPSGRGDAIPPLGAEVVVITAGADHDLVESALSFPRRRGWIVGEAEVDADIEFRRVGTDWPL